MAASGARRPRVRMVIQPTVSHYRAPFIQELLNSERVEYSLFGLRHSPENRIVRNSIKAAEGSVLSQVDPLRARAWRTFRWEFGVVRDVVNGRYDAYVLEGRIFTISTWVALVLGRALNRKVLLWGHGWKRSESGLKRLARITFYRLARGLFFYGDGARGRAIEYGIPPEKIRVVYNSIYPAQRLANAPLGDRDGDKPYRVVVSCRLTPRHRLNMIAEAIALLAPEKRPSVTIIGDGTEMESLKSAFRDLGVEAEFMGACYELDELSRVYGRCDLALSPAASGLNVIQALGFGVPIVVPDDDPASGPEAEVVEHGVNGFRFREGDAGALAAVLAEGFERRAELRRMGQRARDAVLEKYTSRAHASRFDEGVTQWLR